MHTHRASLSVQGHGSAKPTNKLHFVNGRLNLRATGLQPSLVFGPIHVPNPSLLGFAKLMLLFELIVQKP
eukprot:6491210-Amphidinium_carterae.1